MSGALFLETPSDSHRSDAPLTTRRQRIGRAVRTHFVVLGVALLTASEATLEGDWKGDLAKHAIRRVAQEGIEEAFEEAFEDAAQDAAFVAAGTVVRELDWEDVEPQDVVTRGSTVGANAGEAIETAMTVANVADGIEDVLDVVDVAQKLNNARKIIGRIPRR